MAVLKTVKSIMVSTIEKAKNWTVAIVSLFICLFWGWYSIILGLYRWMRAGTKYWKVKERPLPPKCLQDAAYGRHAYIKLKDVKLHYVENGDRNKPLMLFLHGFPQFWFCWRHQLKHFAKDYWCVAVDLRGFGDSERPEKLSDYEMQKLVQDVVELIKGFGKEKCILVAHDWGGGIAWQVAIWVPQVVEKLVIANSPHPADLGRKIMTSIPQFLKSWYLFFFKLPLLPELFLHNDDLAYFDRLLVDNQKKPLGTPEEIEAYKYIYSRKDSWTGPLSYYRANINFKRMALESDYPKVRVPTLIIWGEKDLALSRDLAERATKHVNTIHVEYLPEASHFVQEDKPEEFNAALEDYLTQR